ncbi:hypothetical protein FS749_012227 [Ceratobasidium sp. UAMH 11750]|nr:hypothetical protein FS749_012227 [Ceratobasidium sp. UAMH 11750]
MDALDLDTSYCIVCNQFIWPERYQVAVEPLSPRADPSTVRASKKTGTVRPSARASVRPKQQTQPTLRRAASARKASPAPVQDPEPEMAPTKLRTVISQEPTPIYCSDVCRSHDVESGNRAETSLKTLFDPSYSPCKASPISPLISGSESDLDTDHSNAGYFARLLPRRPWLDRRMSSTSSVSMSSCSSTSSGKEYLYENRRRAREYLAESAARLSRADSPCQSALPLRNPSRSRAETVTVLPPVPERPAAVPFTHRRFKESSHHAMPLPLPTAPDASELYCSYPLSTRTRSSASVKRDGSPSALSSSVPDSSERTPTPSVYDLPSSGSLSAEHTKGLLVRPVLIRSESTSSVSALSRSWDDDDVLKSLRDVTIDPRNKRERDSRKQRKALVKARTLQNDASAADRRMFPWGTSHIDEVGPTYPVLQIPRPKVTVVKTVMVRETNKDGTERLVERKFTEEIEEEPKKSVPLPLHALDKYLFVFHRLFTFLI